MTTIKKLVMRGFKSFGKRTEIPFGNRFNCLLGPNGSGKSNVTEALCFVLGKISAKGMRAEKSANLIFNGGKKGQPAKDAEVSITFDNSNKDFPIEVKEVEISRTVKQNGTSVYRINNEVRTRQQVVDLLHSAKIDPDGYNIILQNDITLFIEMKNDTRRQLIEEVAGISVFEEKKQKAMNELDKVQEKLNETDIILTERQKTLNDLKKDRDQALEYKELEKNIKRNKATSLNLRINEREEKVNEMVSRLGKHEEEISSIHKEIEAFKQEIVEKREEIVKINEIIKDSGDRKQKEISSKLDELKENLVRHQSRKDVCEGEIKKINERKKQLEKEVNDSKSKIEKLEAGKRGSAEKKKSLEKEESLLAEKITSLKEREGLGGKQKLSLRLKENEEKFNEIQNKIAAAHQKKQDSMRLKDIALAAINTTRGKLDDALALEKENAENANKLKELKKEFADIAKSLAKNLNESSLFSAQLGSSRSELMGLSDKLSRIEARSMGMRELAGIDAAIATVKDANIGGVYGTVNELANVSSKHSLALNVAAGPKIRSIVVNTDAIAAQCIKLLKEKRTGVATFLPLNKLKEKEIEEEARNICKMPGVIGLAIELVAFDSKFKSVFKYVFGSTVVVETLETARKIGVGRARMVTLEGDLLEYSGAMVGGYRKEGGMGFKEKELGIDAQKVSVEIEKLKKKVELLEDNKTKVEEVIIGQRERKAVLESQIKALQEKGGKGVGVKAFDNEILSKENEVKSLDKSMIELDQEINNLDSAIKGLKEERVRIVESLSQKGSTIAEELNTLGEQKQKLRESILTLDSEFKNLDNQAILLTREAGKIGLILQNSEKELFSFVNEFNVLEKGIDNEKEAFKQMQKEQERFYKEYKELFTKRTKLDETINKKQTQIATADLKSRNVEEKRNKIVVEKAVLSGELEGLKKEFEQYADVQLRRNMPLEDLNAEIKSFEHMLANMGNVNLRALEIYERANEEYNVIKEKYEKLKLEKEDVLNLMYEIEGKKKASFMKTFNVLKRNFTDIFSTLSTKGEASLILENEEDPFAAGLVIEVRIGFNKYLDIISLSGGEQALAALSFIFAIQNFNPAPFYIMDEVDAALDKKNSEIFSKLIAQYAEKAQYIIITHNDAVISESELLYGVSMQDDISRVVSLRV